MHDKERTALVEHYLDDSPAPGHHSRGAPSWTVCWLRCVLLDWLASQQRTHWKIARTTEGGEGCAAYLESDGVISDTRNNATIYCIYFVSLPGLLLLQLSGRFLVLPRHGLMSCCVARSPSSLVHTMYCTVVYRSNSASILVLNLDPGTFRFICSSPGEEFKTLSSTKQFMPMFFLFSFFFPSSSSNVLHPLCYSFNPQKENPKAPKNRKVTFFLDFQVTLQTRDSLVCWVTTGTTWAEIQPIARLICNLPWLSWAPYDGREKKKPPHPPTAPHQPGKEMGTYLH